MVYLLSRDQRSETVLCLYFWLRRELRQPLYPVHMPFPSLAFPAGWLAEPLGNRKASRRLRQGDLPTRPGRKVYAFFRVFFSALQESRSI
jgi:hypothetical protein